MRQVHLEIRGRVQGVGFRWFVRETGRQLGLSGWVRNRSDGAVELAASGPDERIEQFLREVSRGPSGARVERIEHLPAGQVGELDHPFTVHRE